MGGRDLRAVWFGFFATLALVVGAFLMGYGVSLMSNPSGSSASSMAALPPLLPTSTPISSGTDPAIDTRTVAGGSGLPTPEVTATPTSTETGEPVDSAVTAQGSSASRPSENVGLVASLDSLDLNGELGGVELVIQLRNNTGQPMAFSFSPATDLSVTDSQGNHYNLRWAEFDGSVKVAPRQGARLVRAFFSGSPGEGTRYLTVTVAHSPQLPSSSWQVPVSR